MLIILNYTVTRMICDIWLMISRYLLSLDADIFRARVQETSYRKSLSYLKMSGLFSTKSLKDLAEVFNTLPSAFGSTLIKAAESPCAGVRDIFKSTLRRL